MEEIDFNFLRTYPHHFAIELSCLRSNIIDYCKNNPDDTVMEYCKDGFEEMFEFYSDILGTPTAVKTFDNQEERDEWLEQSKSYDNHIVLFDNPFDSCDKVVFVTIHKKVAREVKGFWSKQEALDWLEQKEKEGQKSFENHSKQLFRLSDEKEPQRTSYLTNIKEYGDYWVTECFGIGELQRKLFSTIYTNFEEWFSKEMAKENFDTMHYTFKLEKEKYLVKLFDCRCKWEINVLDFQTYYHETPLWFLLTYNFLMLSDLHEFLDYHLLNTFKSDNKRYKTYLCDALLIYEDRMTFERKHLVKLKNYIEGDLDNTTTITNSHIQEIETNKNSLLGLPESDLADIESGEGGLKKEQINRFFSLFSMISNNERTPFLTIEEVKTLQMIGLRLPIKGKPSTRLKMNISETEKNIVYQLFYSLWEHNRRTEKGGTKPCYAQFLQTYFSNFPENTNSVKESMRKGQGNKIQKFEAFYLMGEKISVRQSS